MLEGGQRGRQREDGAAPGPPVRRAVGRSLVLWVGRSDPRRKAERLSCPRAHDVLLSPLVCLLFISHPAH
ncbi:unnamed protein product [Boreogadus saida]